MAQTTTTAIQPRSWSSAVPAVKEEAEPADGPAPISAPDIQARLEEQVVGQRSALRELSLLLAMHGRASDGLRAPNAIVMGPTGVGKTYSLSAAARDLGLPFIVVDATSMVPAGIVGEQIEDIVESLVRAADALLSATEASRRRNDDVALAARGVILVDEFDKLASPEDGLGSGHAERRSVQRRLLKLAEGARTRVGVRRHDDGYRERYLDTSGILLLMSGAFTPLTDPGAWRMGATPQAATATPADIVEAGFLPELIGRFPVVIDFQPLSPADLVGILDHPTVSPLHVWRRYLRATQDAGLRLDDAAKWVVAERAAMLGMGARGLQHVLFPVLAARTGEARSGGRTMELVLRAAEFMPEPVAMPVAAVVQ